MQKNNQLSLGLDTETENSQTPETIDIDALARRIRSFNRTVVREILAIGRDLHTAKSMLPHGEWTPYLTRCGITPRTAQRYMGAAELSAKNATVSHLPPSIIYCLASMNITDAELETVIEKAQGQTKVLTPSDIKTILGCTRTADCMPKSHRDDEKFQPLYEIFISAGLANVEVLALLEPIAGARFDALIAYVGKTKQLQPADKPTFLLTHDKGETEDNT